MGARIREYLTGQGTNRRSHGLVAANMGSIPLEIEIRNVLTRDELPQLGDELPKQFDDEEKCGVAGSSVSAEDQVAWVNCTETTFSDYFRNISANIGCFFEAVLMIVSECLYICLVLNQDQMEKEYIGVPGSGLFGKEELVSCFSKKYINHMKVLLYAINRANNNTFGVHIT